jgi:Mrp family chromosome partitioning ATPase
MSKIEEALKKAREMQVSGAPGAIVSETGQGSAAAEEIARMAEPVRRSNADLASRRIIFPAMRDTRVRDSFRDLRTSVVQRSAGANAVVLVTSATPDGGSSFVATNLAAAIAFDENRTALLVDCNLSDPVHDSLVVGENPLGLTDFLRDQNVAVSEIIHPSGVSRLRVIPIGRNKDPGPEYFALLKMQKLFRELKQRYRERFIVVDAPSVGTSADVRMLAELCDIAVLVVPYASATDAQIEAAVNSIGEQRLLGTVINNEPSSMLFARWL